MRAGLLSNSGRLIEFDSILEDLYGIDKRTYDVVEGTDSLYLSGGSYIDLDNLKMWFGIENYVPLEDLYGIDKRTYDVVEGTDSLYLSGGSYIDLDNLKMWLRLYLIDYASNGALAGTSFVGTEKIPLSDDYYATTDALATGLMHIDSIERVKTAAELTTAIAATPAVILVVSPIDLTAATAGDWEIPSGTRFVSLPGSVVTTDATHTLTFAAGSHGPGPDVTRQCFAGAGVTFTDPTVVYPQQWGIDGTTDETEINYAIAALPAGSAVELFGSYSTDSPIILKSGVNLVTRTNATVTITVANAAVIQGTDVSNIVIDGPTLVGMGGSTAYGYGVAILNDSSYVTVRNCNISHMPQMGIVFISGTGNDYGPVHCKAINNTIKYSAQFGVWIGNVTSSAVGGQDTWHQIIGNDISESGFDENGDVVHPMGRGILVENTSKNTLARNLIYHVSEYCIRIWSEGFPATHNIIYGNIIDGGGYSKKGIFLYDEGDHNMVAENIVTGITKDDPSHGQNIVLTGNNNTAIGNITDGGLIGIQSYVASGNAIIGNQVADADTTGISFAKKSVVGQNRVEMSGSTGYGIVGLSDADMSAINGNLVDGGAQGIRLIYSTNDNTLLGNILLNQSDVSVYDYSGDAVRMGNWESLNSGGQSRPRKIVYYYTIPNRGTWQQGDWILKSGASTGSSPGWVCITSGTVSTLSGVTGSIDSGSRILTVNTATGLYVGNFITVVGVTGTKKVTDISGTTITLDSASDATVTDAAVAYAAPAFEAMAATVP